MNTIVSVIIPVYGTFEALRPCLESVVRADEDLDFEIIVVDDASPSSLQPMLSDEFPDVRFIRRARNGGFAAAVNTGVAEVDSAVQFLAVLNSDTTVEKDWLARQIKVLRHDDSYGATAPLIVQSEDPTKIDSAGLGYTVAGWAYRRGFGHQLNPRWTTPTEVFGPTGCAAVYRRSALPHHDRLFNEHLVCYYEDTALAMALRQRGIRTAFVPNAVVRHDVSGAYGKLSQVKAFHTSRNVELVFWSSMPGRLLWRGVVDHALFNGIQFVQAIRHGAVRSFLRGKWAAATRLPQGWRNRRQLKRPGAVKSVAPWIERGWLSEARRQSQSQRS